MNRNRRLGLKRSAKEPDGPRLVARARRRLLGQSYLPSFKLLLTTPMGCSLNAPSILRCIRGWKMQKQSNSTFDRNSGVAHDLWSLKLGLVGGSPWYIFRGRKITKMNKNNKIRVPSVNNFHIHLRTLVRRGINGLWIYGGGGGEANHRTFFRSLLCKLDVHLCVTCVYMLYACV